MFEAPSPWNLDNPWNQAWMLPITVLLLEKALTEAENLCRSARERGRQHGYVLTRQHILR